MSDTQDRRKGVWVAYHDDWSGAAVFASEVACLRHAVDNSMSASFVEYGVELREAVRAQGQTRLRPRRKPKPATVPPTDPPLPDDRPPGDDSQPGEA